MASSLPIPGRTGTPARMFQLFVEGLPPKGDLVRRKQCGPKLCLPGHPTQLPKPTGAWVRSGNLIVKIDLGGDKGGV